MQDNIYELHHTQDLISPVLIYYKDIIVENTKKAIVIAGGTWRLWPHVKSHKMAEMVKLQIGLGITRFKCATVAEAEMLAAVGAKDILLAYPLVGPNIMRYIRLAKAYPDSTFYAIGDDYAQIVQLADTAKAAEMCIPVLIDINVGMNRTGIVLDNVQALYEQCARLAGIKMVGMHCYDGNHNNSDFKLRNEAVAATDAQVEDIQVALRAKGIVCDLLVMGGTPSFPCHALNTKWYLSPGTAFVTDMGYHNNLPDLDFVPGAALFTRVISHPDKGLFTLDLGYKGIASDPVGVRGVIVGLENAAPLFQSEEHWVFTMDKGCKAAMPPIGTGLYIIPTHICPTSALYPSILVAQNGEIIDTWEVVARNRKLTF